MSGWDRKRWVTWGPAVLIALSACDGAPTSMPVSHHASRSTAEGVPCPARGRCDLGVPGVARAVRDASTTWLTGDAFAGISGGSYTVYDNRGAVKETIDDGLGGFTTGCSFDPALTKLYTTNFSSAQIVVRNDVDQHAIAQVLDVAAEGGGGSESIVFDAAGNFYVGNAGGSRQIFKYDATGTIVAKYTVATENVGSDWIELARDQRTMYYTSEGSRVLAYDVVSATQLPDFANIGSGSNFALRLLPPGDATNGMLVAHLHDIVRLDGSGRVVQTYDAPGEDTWFALNLDPNGTSFWSGSIVSGNLYRFNIATGAVEVGPVPSSAGLLFGLCLRGEPTGALPPSSAGFEIDIEPEDSANAVRLAGVRLAVGVKSTSGFDATQIRPTTCRISGGAEGVRPIVSSARLVDFDRDGDRDLLLIFSTRALVLSGNLTTSTTSMTVKCGPQRDSDVVAPI